VNTGFDPGNFFSFAMLFHLRASTYVVHGFWGKSIPIGPARYPACALLAIDFVEWAWAPLSFVLFHLRGCYCFVWRALLLLHVIKDSIVIGCAGGHACVWPWVPWES
jgi:hypothetical protein